MYCLTYSYQQPHKEDTISPFFAEDETEAYGHVS